VITTGDERWVGQPTLSCRASPWALFAGVFGVLIVGYFALPAAGLPEAGRTVLYVALSATAALAITVVAIRQRPAGWPAWVLLAGSQVMSTLADTSYFFAREVHHDRTFPALADLFYLLVYPLIIAGLLILIRRRTPGWHAPTALDAAIIGTATALLWWVYLFSPLAVSPHMTLPARLVTVAYPIMDLLVLAIGLRLVVGAGGRTPAFHLLITSLVLMLAGDAVYSVEQSSGSWMDFGWVDALWLASYGAMGAAALHPSASRLDKRSVVPPPDATPGRLAVLATASLVAPAVLVIEYARGRHGDVPVIATACAILFLLVLTRMAGVVAAQRRVAITDGLTGAYTRRFFEENLRVEAERARRGGLQAGLLLIDVDHFKLINDTYGHPAGDQVLRELARRLRSICRPGDIVARFGGEEFALLLPGAGLARVARLAERIRRDVAATPFAFGDGTLVPLTVSVGAASLPSHGSRPYEVVHAADEALYAAKRAGRDRSVVGPVSDRPVPAAEIVAESGDRAA
jgi:two-component system cell cycle response regulator